MDHTDSKPVQPSATLGPPAMSAAGQKREAPANPRPAIYWKRVPLFDLVEKIKLWPSRQGVLHGVRLFERSGPSYARVVTHCGEQTVIRNSKNSRAARWLRNKWHTGTCSKCAIPDWKVSKFGATLFKSGRAAAALKAGRPMPPEDFRREEVKPTPE